MRLFELTEEIRSVKKTASLLSRKSLIQRDYLRFFRPVDYTRTAELPIVLSTSDILTRKQEFLKILDISSPQILSATLAGVTNRWKITYGNPFKPELTEMDRIIELLSLENVNTKELDITSKNDIENLENDYDYVFSASVFEHIHPEEGGDTSAVANIHKLLKPGGLFVFSVPFYRESFNEYKYGDIYSIKGGNNKKTFFQRFYDEEKLREQLIMPSKLATDSIMFIGEKFYYPDNIEKRMAQLMNTKINSIFLGHLYFYISNIFFSYSNDYQKLRKPYIAVVGLRKVS